MQYDIFEIIKNYVDEHIQCEIFTLPAVGAGLILIIKDLPKGSIAASTAISEFMASSVESGANAEMVWHQRNNLDAFFAQLGKRFPAITIAKDSTEVTINYSRVIMFDYVDPQFFQHFDKLLSYIMEHNDLSQFV